MQLATNSVLSQPPLAAMPQLSEKPRLGFATKKTAWNPGPNVCNFTVTLGLRATVVENGVRKTYSARYYNPSTGRFMSRDPEAGNRFSPASLHKYLYAGGDPVNMVDPSGRDMFETGAILAHEFLKVAVLRAGISACLFKVFTSIEKDLENPKSLGNGMGIASDVFSCAVTIGAAFVAMAFI